MSRTRPRRLSLSIKILYTLWVIVLIPVWVSYQGWNNFLWFSDVAFFATCLALWWESRLLASMTAVGILLPDLAWTLHFFADLIVDTGLLEQSGFMFDEQIPLFVRGLSLFHVAILPLLVWMVYRLGYDRRALVAQTLLAWLVLPASYVLTDPAENINFVFGFGQPPQPPIPQPWWLILEMVLLPAGVYLPTHLLLARWFGRAARRAAGAEGHGAPTK